MSDVSYADITTAMNAAVAALTAGDYGLARDKALAAQALSSVLPDTSRQIGAGGSEGLTWDRVAISTFLDRMQRIANSAVGVQSSRVVICPVRNGGVSQLGIW
jgi:hypothetical protein